MAVSIYKKTDLNTRYGKVKTKYIESRETYPEALERIKELESKNKNPNASYYTGNIYR